MKSLHLEETHTEIVDHVWIENLLKSCKLEKLHLLMDIRTKLNAMVDFSQLKALSLKHINFEQDLIIKSEKLHSIEISTLDLEN